MKNIILHPTTFTLPSDGNSITANDVKKKQLRITAAFKSLFPESDDELKITIKTTHNLVFKHRNKRSHILKLGSEAFVELGIKEGDKVDFTKIGIKEFKIEVVK